jgi:hypothetical protein
VTRPFVHFIPIQVVLRLGVLLIYVLCEVIMLHLAFLDAMPDQEIRLNVIFGLTSLLALILHNTDSFAINDVFCLHLLNHLVQIQSLLLLVDSQMMLD